MGQIPASLANRPQRSLTSNTETNPKEQENMITLRSGWQLEQDKSENTNAESLEETKKSNIEEHRKPEKDKDQQMANPPSEWLLCHPETVAEPELETVKKVPMKPYVSLVSFP